MEGYYCFFVKSGTFVGPNRTCLEKVDITMESGLFLDSHVDIWRHNIIGDVCGIGHACGTGPISKSFIYIMVTNVKYQTVIDIDYYEVLLFNINKKSHHLPG